MLAFIVCAQQPSHTLPVKLMITFFFEQRIDDYLHMMTLSFCNFHVLEDISCTLHYSNWQNTVTNMISDTLRWTIFYVSTCGA